MFVTNKATVSITKYAVLLNILQSLYFVVDHVATVSLVPLFSSNFSFCFAFIAVSRSLMSSSSSFWTMLGSLPRISHWNISDLGRFSRVGVWGCQ